MRKNRRTHLLIGATLAVTALVGATGTASAAPRQPTRTTLTETTMHVGGFNAAVAEAHGYEIRTAPSGEQYSVEKGSPPDAKPAGEVGGSCGRSWVYETAQGNRTVWLETGYQVISGTNAHSWSVRLRDPGGSSTVGYPSHGTNGYWVSNRYVGGLTPGDASATVTVGSWAELWDGRVCYSGGPSATTRIY